MEKMNETVSSRLKLYIESLGLTDSQFADMCGIPRPTLSQILTGRNKKVSDALIRQIHSAFPDLSIVWLLFNEGPVKTSESAVSPQNGAYSSAQNSVSPSGLSQTPEFSKENGLNPAFQTNKSTENKVFESDLKILDLQNKIEKMKQNPRKVVQITIYYDDSTFETFTPK